MPGASTPAIRLERALAICRKLIPVVGELAIMDILHHFDCGCGSADCWFSRVSYSEEGALQLTGLTDLQVVAVAATLIAYREGMR